MSQTYDFPNAQNNPAAAIPVRLSDGSAFYVASGGGGGGGTPATTATITEPAASITVETVLAANAARLSAKFFNSGTGGNVFLSYGAGASLTAFTVKLVPGAYYNMEYLYTGAFTAIWDTLTNAGALMVTELTP